MEAGTNWAAGRAAGAIRSPMGAGVFAPVSEVRPGRHLVAQEAYVLRPAAPRAAAARPRPAVVAAVKAVHTHNIPAIHAPLPVLMTYLHARNLQRRGRLPRTWRQGPELVWFEHSGHEPFADEPGKFNATMADLVRPALLPDTEAPQS